MAAQRLLRTIARDEAAQFATRRFDRRIRLTRWWREAFGENLEVVDERFHLRLHLFATGRDDARRFGAERPFRREFVDRLANDLQALAHFRDADEIPGEAVRFGARGHVKLKFVVARIGKRLAKVM